MDNSDNRSTRPPALRRILRARESGVLGALAVMVVVMSFLNPYFLGTENIFNVLRGVSTIGIMAIGETLVVVAGCIDLSVGSLLAVSAMFTARLMTYHGVPPWFAVLGGLALGLGLGGINGLLVTKGRINSFVATLGMLSVARGLTYLMASGLAGTVGSNIPMQDPGVRFLGAGYIGKVPFAVIEMAVLVALASLFMRTTVLGRQLYAVGSNEQAARLCGVNVGRVRRTAYVVSGGCCALAGIMNAGLLSTASTNQGMGNELDVIAAVVMGGASLQGGEGTVYGALIGAAVMAVLRNAFVLLQFPIHGQTVAIGVVIILAVGTDRLRGRKE